MNPDLNAGRAGKKTVTVAYHSNRVDTYRGVDKITSEAVQWRLDAGAKILLIPMTGVRAFLMEDEA